jgi:hypothetical protein
MEVDGFVLVPRDHGSLAMVGQNDSHKYMADIDNAVESFLAPLESLNQYIHDNPELAFKERKAHEALTRFMSSQKDWQVTSAAYGIDTAWVAVYDSGKAGPVVSFNAEMGMIVFHLLEERILVDIAQMHFLTWVTRAVTISSQQLRSQQHLRQPTSSQNTIYPERLYSSVHQEKKAGAAAKSVSSKQVHIRMSISPSSHTRASTIIALV